VVAILFGFLPEIWFLSETSGKPAKIYPKASGKKTNKGTAGTGS